MAYDIRADSDTIDGVIRAGERYRSASQPRFRAFIRNHRLYTADPRINDPRDPVKEKGRSWVTVPKAFMNTNAAAATVVDVLTSVDPMVRAMRVADTKQDEANYAERVLDYIATGNKLRTRIFPALARNIEIQGSQPIKVGWADRSRMGTITTSQEDYEDWWLKVMEAARHTSAPPDLRTDPIAFEVWAQQAEQAGHPIPPRPQPTGPQLIKGYKGPWFTLPSIWNLWLDPTQEELQLQECIIERIVQPQSYIDAKLKQPNFGGLDPEAVAHARGNGRGKGAMDRFNEFQTAFYRYLDIDPQQFLAKSEYTTHDVVYEVYMPNNPEQKFLTMLNEAAIINRRRDVSPYPFGDAPYVMPHRIAIPGSAYGMSPYQPTERLMYEQSALRSLRFDAMSFSATPAFTVLNAAYASLPASMRQMKMGGMYPVPIHEALKSIDIKVPREVFLENSETSNDIDEAWGIGANVRGQQAVTGRVPATESSARQTQATLPLIQVARAIEAAFEETIPWQFLMVREYCTEGEMLVMGGAEGASSMKVEKSRLSEVMQGQYRFQGATSTRNRETTVTLLGGWLKNAGADLRPWERREAHAIALRLLGIPGADQLVDPMVTSTLKMIDTAPPPGIDPETGQPLPPGAPGLGAPGVPGAPMPGGPGMPGMPAPPGAEGAPMGPEGAAPPVV